MEEKILTRVRALLAKAESTDYPAEAEALTAKAVQLMAAHGIEQAHLAAAGSVRDEISSCSIRLENPYAIDKDCLLYGIVASLRCKAIKRKHSEGGYAVTVVGFQSDLDRVELLYTSLLVQAVGQLTHIRPSNGGSTVSYRKSWLLGFSVAVRDRLEQAERTAASTSEAATESSTALVLADRVSQVEHAYNRLFPNTRAWRSRTLGRSGYDDGKAAGRRADLGNGRVSGGQVAIGHG